MLIEDSWQLAQCCDDYYIYIKQKIDLDEEIVPHPTPLGKKALVHTSLASSEKGANTYEEHCLCCSILPKQTNVRAK